MNRKNTIGCLNAWHKSCIDTWLIQAPRSEDKAQKCPTCRALLKERKASGVVTLHYASREELLRASRRVLDDMLDDMVDDVVDDIVDDILGELGVYSMYHYNPDEDALTSSVDDDDQLNGNHDFPRSIEPINGSDEPGDPTAEAENASQGPKNDPQAPSSMRQRKSE